MKTNAIALLLVLALFVGLLPTVSAETAGTVNVMSYNLKNTNYSFSDVASMATLAGADIVCMQEVCSLQKSGMNSAMSSAGYGVVEGKSSGANSITEADEYLPIYYTSGKYTLLRGGTFWLSDTGSVQSKYDGSSYYRICTWAYFRITGTSDYILVFNTHLDFQVEVMIKQVNVILNQIIVKSSELTNAWDHIILAGDLNASNISVVCQYLQGDAVYNGVANTYTKQRLDEARQIASSVTLNSFGNAFTQPASDPTMDLDHIFVTSKGFVCDSYQILSDAAGSDHLPVLAKLRFKTDHDYTYTWTASETHKLSCKHCGDSATESCTTVDGYCTLCGGSSGTRSFELVKSADALTSGRYVIVSKAIMGDYTGDYAYYAVTKQQDSGYNALCSQGMDFSDLPDTITLEGADIASLVWNLDGTASGFTLSGNAGEVLCRSGIDLLCSDGTPTMWTADYSKSNGHFAVKHNGTGYLSLRTDWATLTSSDTAAPLVTCVGNTDTGNYKMFFFKESGSCMHENLTASILAPTCTAQGYTSHSCPDCGYSYTTDNVAATGHDYQGVVTPPTSTEQGYTTYTCSVCGDSYVGDYTEIVEVYTLSFAVPSGVEEPAPMVGKSGLVLPGVAGTPDYAPADAVFVGWVTSEYDNVNAGVSGTIFKEGISCSISADVTLYALYEYHSGEGVIEKTFTLHDGSRGLYIGDSVLLVAADYACAMSATQNENDRSGVAVNKSEDGTSIVITDENVAIFTLGWGVEGNAEKNRISFQDANGYLCVPESAQNYLLSQSTLDAYGSWSVTRNTDTQNMIFTSQGVSINNVLRYYAESNVFAANDAAEESAVHIYILTAEMDPTSYYTTVFHKAQCVHKTTTLQGSYAAGCAKDGYTGDEVCAACGEVVASGTVIPATGHSYGYTDNGDDTHAYACAACGDGYFEDCSYVDGVCVCGAVSKAPVADVDLTFTNHALSLASSIEVSFIIKTEKLTYDSYRIVIEKDLYDENGNVVGVDTCEFTGFATYNASYSKVVLDTVAATEMTAELRATVYGYKNGVEYVGDTDVYSVKQYAMNQLNKSAAETKLKALCADLLNYGAAAQIYKNYHVDALANAEMTEEMMAYAGDVGTLSLTNIKTQHEEDGASVTFVGNALQMNDKVEVMYIFSGLEGVSVDISYTDSQGNLITRTFAQEDMAVYNASAGYYSIKVDSLTAAEMSVPITAVLYLNSVKQSTCVYSIESYCARQYQKDTDLGACCAMMMLYGNSAAAYFRE